MKSNIYPNFTVFIVLFYCLETYGQQIKLKEMMPVVSIDVGGPGLLSLNYDQRFTSRGFGLGAAVGGGALHFISGSVVTCTAELNYLKPLKSIKSGPRVRLVEKEGKNAFAEFSAGGGYHGSYNGLTAERKRNYTPFLKIGYRVQAEPRGFMFKVYYSPMFIDRKFVYLYGGLSFGYKF
jgi:hypothetical protein